MANREPSAPPAANDDGSALSERAAAAAGVSSRETARADTAAATEEVHKATSPKMAASGKATDRAYEIFDVFTDQPFAGNPLAVVHGAEGLSDAAMQSIAREFNLSETVFVLPPADARHRARVRIFTPGTELPFAGHPTVGAAVALALADKSKTANLEMLVLEETVGPVRCVARLASDTVGFAEFDVPRQPEILSVPLPDMVRLSRALGLAPDHLADGEMSIQAASAGTPFTFVELVDAEALAAVRPDLSCWEATFGAAPSQVFAFTTQTGTPSVSIRARMFAPTLGIMEDPATGAAAAALPAVLAEIAGEPPQACVLAIEQGVEMGRKSRIRVDVEVSDTGFRAIRIGGDAVKVASGHLHV